MQQSKPALPAALEEPSEPVPHETMRVKIKDRLDPLALSGTTNMRFAKRLVDQVATCQVVPPGADEKTQTDKATTAIAALQELTPANAIDGLLATQMVAAHNASLDLLGRAMVVAQSPRVVEESTRQYARISEVFLKQLDRYTRNRGRQRKSSASSMCGSWRMER